jgi:hypothetical protein
MSLYCDVWKNLEIELHSGDCKDVDRAKAKGFKCGTIEGDHFDDAIVKHILISEECGILLDRSCYRVMPCVKKAGLE